MFSVPIKGISQCYASLHLEEYGHMRRGTFTTQVKRYMSGSKPCCRDFVTIGKQTNHAKQSRDSTQAHVLVIYW